MRWFMSDPHFGHTNIAGPKVSTWTHGYRDFDSVNDMDYEILRCINEYVGESDELYILGDFSHGNGSKKPQSYLDRIVCKHVHLILGNHDKAKDLRKCRFASIEPYKEIYLEGKNKLCMFHYAMRVWNKSHYGSLHIYGHSHNSIDNNWGRSMDVGVDAIYDMFGEYRPISEYEILNILLKRQIKLVDHHI